MCGELATVVSPMRQFFSSVLDDRNERRVVLGFFTLFFVIGLFSARQFGIPTDMGTMDALGHDAYAYVFQGAKWPENPAWRYHGTVVELPSYILQGAVANRENPLLNYKRVITQHLVVFLLSFVGIIALYFLAKKHFRDWRWALLPCVMYVLTPRFFAHSFYNARDIPELAFFTLSMLTLVLFMERRTYIAAVLHGLATALALALRMPSLIIVVLSAFFLILDAAQKRLDGEGLAWKRTLLLFATYVAIAAVATICFWPFLWSDPLGHYLEAYRFMSESRGSAGLFGRSYATTPWFYVPVWMFITVPLVFTGFFLYGFVLFAARFVRRPLDVIRTRKKELLFAAWFVLPLASIVITGAGIYNEWRHVFFVYPAFLLLAVVGIRELADVFERLSPKLRLLPQALIALQLLGTGCWMVANHPLEFAYFSLPKAAIDSILPDERVDYWGLSYREAVRFILDDSPGVLTVYSPENVAFQNAYNVFPKTLSRVMRVPSPDEAMYVLFPSSEKPLGLPVAYDIRVDGHLLSSVYRGPVKEVIIDKTTGQVTLRK